MSARLRPIMLGRGAMLYVCSSTWSEYLSLYKVSPVFIYIMWEAIH